LAEIDAWSENIRPKPKRSAAARELIIEGLESFKRKAGVAKPKRGEK
jgi:hypothetical protein